MKTDEEIIEWLNQNGFYIGTSRHLELAKLCIKQGYTEAAEICGRIGSEKSLRIFPGANFCQESILTARDQIK